MTKRQSHSLQLRTILERSRQQFRDGEWLSEKEFWSQFQTSKPSKSSAKPKKPPKSRRAS